MNKDRRARLASLQDLLTGIREVLDAIRDEEEEAFVSLPESLQQSDRGMAMEDAINNMTDAADAIEDVVGYIEEARA